MNVARRSAFPKVAYCSRLVPPFLNRSIRAANVWIQIFTVNRSEAALETSTPHHGTLEPRFPSILRGILAIGSLSRKLATLLHTSQLTWPLLVTLWALMVLQISISRGRKCNILGALITRVRAM